MSDKCTSNSINFSSVGKVFSYHMPSHLSQSPCNVSTITSIYVFSYVPFMYTLTQKNRLNNDPYLVVDSYLIFQIMTLDLYLYSRVSVSILIEPNMHFKNM